MRFIVAAFAAMIALLFGAYAYTPAPPALPGSTVKIVMEQGHGSGVHIGNGYVVTAAHVVVDKVPRIKLDDGSEQDAVVLWANKAHDIALLRTASTMSASSLDCRVAANGEYVTAEGNPTVFEFVSSAGRIAGVERAFGPWVRVLPVDMTIVMGMSGGPVFAADGRVVGISVGVLVAPVGFAASLTGFGAVVPSAAVCELLARV